MRISVYIIANQNIRIHKPSPPRIIIAKQGMRRIDNSMHRKSRQLLKSIVILSIENPQSHTDNARKYGAQKIADTLRTRMLGKSPVCQNSGVGKKGEMSESCQQRQQWSKTSISNRKQKILSSRCSLRVCQHAHTSINQKKIVYLGNESSGSRTHDLLLRRDAHRFPFRELHCPVMPDFPAFPADFYVFDGGQRNVKNRNFQPCC